MKRVIVGIVTALCLLHGAPAGASEQSKLLYSRGLVEFHAGHLSDALKLFDQAVAADGEDTYARYYRAVTRGRLNDFAGAIADLRAVLKARPDLDQAALDLGVALVQTNEYRDALRWLEQARHTAELDGQASLFLGIAQLRLGRIEAARRNFLRAAEKDPEQALVARYYEGVANYQEANWSRSAEQFTYVVQTSPDSVMGREAASFLEKIRAAERERYQVHGAVGFQYDTNVVLAPGGDVIKEAAGISKQADGRITLSAGGNYVAWRSDQVQLLLGYEFFQSLHFELHDFNLEDHGPYVQLLCNASVFQCGVLGRYDYYIEDVDSFLQEATVLPWLTIPAGEFGRLELYYRMRRRDFKKQAFTVLDSFNHAVGVRQVVNLGSSDRYISVGYQFDREDPVVSSRLVREGTFTETEAQGFAYDGNELNAGAGWTLPAAISVEGGFVFRHEGYDQASEPMPPHRGDDVYEVIFVARRPLGEYLDIAVGYLGTINHSNDPRFDYDRNIASLTLEVRF